MERSESINKELLLDLERTLNDLGWKIENRTPQQPTISEALSKYSGDIFLAELPIYTKKVADSHLIQLSINSFTGYDGYWVKSSLEEPDPFFWGIGINQEIYKNSSNQSPEKIFKKIESSNQDAIMIAITKIYFSN
jgi:hypothetical protein